MFHAPAAFPFVNSRLFGKISIDPILAKVVPSKVKAERWDLAPSGASKRAVKPRNSMTGQDCAGGLKRAFVNVIGAPLPMLHLQPALDVLGGADDQGLHETSEGTARKGLDGRIVVGIRSGPGLRRFKKVVVNAGRPPVGREDRGVDYAGGR